MYRFSIHCFHFSFRLINLFMFKKNYCSSHSFQVLLHIPLKPKGGRNVSKYCKHQTNERERKILRIFQLFYSCAIRPFTSTLSIMTFMIMKPLEALSKEGERRNIFHESRLLQVTTDISSLVAFSDFHRRDTKANMFYFVICCGAFCART